MKFHVVLFLLLFLLVAWLFEVNYAHPFSSAGILPIAQKEFAHQQKRAAVSLSLRMRSITSQEDLPIARIKEKDAELNFDNGQCLYRNGKVIDDGISRTATKDDLEAVLIYKAQMTTYLDAARREMLAQSKMSLPPKLAYDYNITAVMFPPLALIRSKNGQTPPTPPPTPPCLCKKCGPSEN